MLLSRDGKGAIAVPGVYAIGLEEWSPYGAKDTVFSLSDRLLRSRLMG